MSEHVNRRDQVILCAPHATRMMRAKWPADDQAHLYFAGAPLYGKRLRANQLHIHETWWEVAGDERNEQWVRHDLLCRFGRDDIDAVMEALRIT